MLVRRRHEILLDLLPTADPAALECLRGCGVEVLTVVEATR